MKKLPKELFVTWNEDDEPWLNTSQKIEDLLDSPPDSKKVGVYKLVKTVTAKTDVQFTTIDEG
jgi:hypothetical protein